MSDEGYTYSYRKKWKNPIFRNLLEAAIWAWMCDTAAWKDTKVHFNGHSIDINRGQLVTSIRFIAGGFQMGEGIVRRLMSRLSNDTMIVTKTTHDCTIITLCNYEDYQKQQEQADTPTTRQRNTNRLPADANKKEYKEIKKEVSSGLPWLPIPEWEAFKEMRKGKKNPMTSHAEHLAIQKLDRWMKAGHDPAEILNYSIMNGYPGLYEPKAKQYGQQAKRPTVDILSEQIAIARAEREQASPGAA